MWCHVSVERKTKASGTPEKWWWMEGVCAVYRWEGGWHTRVLWFEGPVVTENISSRRSIGRYVRQRACPPMLSTKSIIIDLYTLLYTQNITRDACAHYSCKLEKNKTKKLLKKFSCTRASSSHHSLTNLTKRKYLYLFFPSAYSLLPLVCLFVWQRAATQQKKAKARDCTLSPLLVIKTDIKIKYRKILVVVACSFSHFHTITFFFLVWNKHACAHAYEYNTCSMVKVALKK